MLTDRAIKSAISDVQTETILTDGAVNGRGAGSLALVIRRLANGSTSALWFARWKSAGRRGKASMGRYPDVGLAQARQKFQAEVSPLIAAGKSPRAAAAPGTVPKTVGRMFEGYVAHMRAKGRASAPEVERMLLLAEHSIADALGRGRLAAEVESGDIVGVISSYYRRGNRGAADKARAYMSAAFGWALKSANDYTSDKRQDWGLTINPAASVPKDSGATTARDRNLTAAELAALWQATGGAGFSLESRTALRLLICCGQRVLETLRIDAEDIDLGAALWTMPAAKTKGGKRVHQVPLPAQAVEALRELLALRSTGPLFPGRSGSKNALIDHRSLQQAIDRWLVTAGLPKFQTRDLRRTWKSRAHDAGVDRYTRDLIQQHAKHDTGSRNYDRAEYLPQMRAAMAKWETWLSAHVVGAGTPIREAA